MRFAVDGLTVVALAWLQVPLAGQSRGRQFCVQCPLAGTDPGHAGCRKYRNAGLRQRAQFGQWGPSALWVVWASKAKVSRQSTSTLLQSQRERSWNF
eukprot:9531043-Alexandrium_andersonii.AAC.1